MGATGLVSLAIAFRTGISIPLLAWGPYGEWVLSWVVSPLLSLHPGFVVSVVPPVTVCPYLGVTLGPLPNLKLILELDGEEPYLDEGRRARPGLVDPDFTGRCPS